MEKKASKKRNKRKVVKQKGLFQRPWFLVSTFGIATLIIITVWGASTFLRSYSGDAVWIHIPSGASRQAVSDSVVKALGNAQGGRVMTIWRLMGGEPEESHGAYKVTSGQMAFSTARNIAKGRQTPVRVTWNNARTLSDMADAVSRNLELTSEDFIEACRSILAPEGFNEATFAAAFLPDTYEFYWDASPEDVVGRIHSYHKKFWTPERKAKAKALGLDPIGVATVASITEEETAKADERGKVARLYINRLKAAMPLQADPTVKFALGDFSIRRIAGRMLQVDSPYNTYRVKGLPPGPIRIPSKSTLQAVLDAPEHDYLYMCAREDFSGYHNFSRDYATHQANACRYQAELNRRNIR